MCKNLVEKGNLDQPLIIFNRTTQRATELQDTLPKGKTTVAETIEDAVSESDIIFTCLGSDAAVQDTIETAVRGNVKGKLFVDCSTVHPDVTEKLAKTIGAQGANFVACPGKTSFAGILEIPSLSSILVQYLAHLQWPTTDSLCVFLQAKHLTWTR